METEKSGGICLVCLRVQRLAICRRHTLDVAGRPRETEGCMVAKLKIKGIDERVPPRAEPAH